MWGVACLPLEWGFQDIRVPSNVMSMFVDVMPEEELKRASDASLDGLVQGRFEEAVTSAVYAAV